MLTYVEESIFSSPARVLVNTVNTVGVMGKGIALEFKKLYPDMFNSYQIQCEEGQFDIGSLQLYKTPNKWVLNFPTKKHWRSPSRVEYIEAGLETFVRLYGELDINSISFPQLGCGNGELDWESQVRPVMEKHLSHLPIDVFVHIYNASLASEHQVTNEMKKWLRSEPRSLSVFEVWTDLFASDMPEIDLSNESPIGNAEKDARDAMMLRPIWSRLRTYGMIGEAEVREQYGDEGIELIEKLSELPYVERSSFAAPATISVIANPSTSELLDRPESQGLRLVPELIPHGFSTLPLWG
jgi:O-acetyl-ADP-ribose deacetylase (regulator of RNase III)